MSPRPETFRRNVILLVSLACAVRVMIWMVSWQTVQRMSDASHELERSQAVIGALESVRSGVQSVAAAERSYVITGSEADLKEFGKAKRLALQNLSILLTFLDDEEDLKDEAEALPVLIDIRFTDAQATVWARRDAGFEAARKRIAGGKGAEQMKEILAHIEEARAEALVHLGARAERQRVDTSRVLNRIAGTAIGSILVLLAVAFWLIPAFDERVAVRDALRPNHKQPVA